MKIEASCDRCRRTFLLSQIGPDSDTPGRCPFCGAHFARHYTTVLVPAVAEAEIMAGRFVDAVARLQAMETGFDIDIDKMLETITERIRAHESQPSPG
jgi:hypothetical protein